MGHEGHHEERKPLGIFASPLHEGPHYAPAHAHEASSHHSSELEHQKTADTNHVPFENSDCALHESPAFHRHAEATTSELFYDLFFVANLTSFTGLNEINDHKSLTAYIGFFSLLWLTWYQVSLYDVRFSSDSVFERCAKAIHFGVMVGFAVIGPQWKPGQAQGDYKIYRAFGLILMVSRFTLFLQYGVTLFYTKKYKKTIIPLAAIMAMTLVAAILYGALTPIFPKTIYDADGFMIDQKSDKYIAWYVIGIAETLVTVCVSCIWRVISFKGTHMVQRMSLLTLIILGEGIIVVCKSISKIIKNDYVWTGAVVGQIVAAVLIIYFLYMLYFDRLQEEHFGTIKQQWWSFMHFPLHTSLVLVLQGVSLLIIWLQAITFYADFQTQYIDVLRPIGDGNITYASGADFAVMLGDLFQGNVYCCVPKGVDSSKEQAKIDKDLSIIIDGYDSLIRDATNETALTNVVEGMLDAFAQATKTVFDGLSVNSPKKDKTQDGESDKPKDPDALFIEYVDIFELVFVYVFVAGGLSLLIITLISFLSLPKHERKPSQYLRLAVNGAVGLGLCLVSLIKFNLNAKYNFLGSSWMIPTLCIMYFICVLANHVRIPGQGKQH